MPYRFLEDIVTADVAFEATASTIEEMFIAAADATMNVMIDDLEQIQSRIKRSFKSRAQDLETLLFEFLQELIFLKDAEQLLTKVESLEIKQENNGFVLYAVVSGEKIDMTRHALNADVKAVTYHRFSVARQKDGWRAEVVLDV